MRIKMIVTDLDGTLLYSDETLPQESVDIISYCRERGGLFVVATSRSIVSAKRITDVLKPDAIISSGGANAICGEDVIYDAVFSVEDSESIVKRCINDKEIDYIRIIGEECDLTNNPDVTFDEKEHGHYIRTDFQEIPQQKISKITLCSSNVNHARATKEDALAEVAKYFRVDFEDIISFGDDTSDINMLKLSRIGVAVDNAKQHVKDVADYICESNDKRGVINYLTDNFEYLLNDNIL